MGAKVLRPHQNDAIQKAIEAFETHQHDRFLFAMPTGTGKTKMAIELGNRYPGIKFFLVPKDQLQDQTIEILRNDFPEQASSWIVRTWQGIKAPYAEGISCCEAVFIDEIQIGAIEECKQIKRAVDLLKTKRLVLMSATPEAINQAVLGTFHSDNTAEMTFVEAVRRGLVNDVRIFAVRPSHLTSVPHEEFFNQTRERTGIKVSKNTPADPRDSYNLQVFADTVFEREPVAKILFFVKNLKLIQELKDYIVQNGYRLEAAIRTLDDSLNDKETATAITDFCTNNAVTLIISCKKLREGFDYPPLEVVADGAFSPNAIHNAKQKLGRVVRLSENKGTSRYYYLHAERREARLKMALHPAAQIELFKLAKSEKTNYSMIPVITELADLLSEEGILRIPEISTHAAKSTLVVETWNKAYSKEIPGRNVYIKRTKGHELWMQLLMEARKPNATRPGKHNPEGMLLWNAIKNPPKPTDRRAPYVETLTQFQPSWFNLLGQAPLDVFAEKLAVFLETLRAGKTLSPQQSRWFSGMKRNSEQTRETAYSAVKSEFPAVFEHLIENKNPFLKSIELSQLLKEAFLQKLRIGEELTLQDKKRFGEWKFKWRHGKKDKTFMDKVHELAPYLLL